jgi:hypothetical protein
MNMCLVRNEGLIHLPQGPCMSDSDRVYSIHRQNMNEMTVP